VHWYTTSTQSGCFLHFSAGAPSHTVHSITYSNHSGVFRSLFLHFSAGAPSSLSLLSPNILASPVSAKNVSSTQASVAVGTTSVNGSASSTNLRLRPGRTRSPRHRTAINSRNVGSRIRNARLAVDDLVWQILLATSKDGIQVKERGFEVRRVRNAS